MRAVCGRQEPFFHAEQRGPFSHAEQRGPFSHAEVVLLCVIAVVQFIVFPSNAEGGFP